jgi:hypothetical protein
MVGEPREVWAEPDDLPVVFPNPQEENRSLPVSVP